MTHPYIDVANTYLTLVPLTGIVALSRCDVGAAAPGWLGVLPDGRLLLRAADSAPGVLRVLSTDDLSEVGVVEQPAVDAADATADEDSEPIGLRPTLLSVAHGQLWAADITSEGTLRFRAFAVAEHELTLTASVASPWVLPGPRAGVTTCGVSPWDAERDVRMMEPLDALSGTLALSLCVGPT